jgi:adenine-specific DNA glycosylase
LPWWFLQIKTQRRWKCVMYASSPEAIWQCMMGLCRNICIIKPDCARFCCCLFSISAFYTTSEQTL